MARRASIALRSPFRIISSSRVRRALTSENSVATKKAFARTSTNTEAMPKPTDVGGADSISVKPNGQAILPREHRMIRRLAVPPFEALEALLPERGGADRGTRDAVSAILE